MDNNNLVECNKSNKSNKIKLKNNNISPCKMNLRKSKSKDKKSLIANIQKHQNIKFSPPIRIDRNNEYQKSINNNTTSIDCDDENNTITNDITNKNNNVEEINKVSMELTSRELFVFILTLLYNQLFIFNS